MARLVVAIEDDHGVTAEQVAIAAAARNPFFDFLVVLLFLPLWVCHRHSLRSLPEAVLFL